MPNLFIRRKMANKPMSNRALRRQATPSTRQQQRTLHNLKNIANQRIRRNLQQRTKE